MSRLRVGTRGSELALRQARWVCELLGRVHGELEFEEIVIKTHGDIADRQPLDASFPAGGFVSAIEEALIAGRVDFAVHSYKDLPSGETRGLTVAAVPRREAAHDVLITRELVELSRIPPGMKIGTSSPRRAAQLRRVADVTIVAIRGNVPTRIAKLQSEGLDGVVLAAAGIRRLELHPPHMVELPIEQFVPAPAQGALAVQARVGDRVGAQLAWIDDATSRRAVDAERSFLHHVQAGCQTPVGAYAEVTNEGITLRGQLFSDDHRRCAEGVETGDDPNELGKRLARRLRRELE